MTVIRKTVEMEMAGRLDLETNTNWKLTQK